MKKIVFGLIALVIISAGSVFAQNKFPGWAKGIVWYQIFPERFADGDTANEPGVDKVFIDMKNQSNYALTETGISALKIIFYENGTIPITPIAPTNLSGIPDTTSIE